MTDLERRITALEKDVASIQQGLLGALERIEALTDFSKGLAAPIALTADQIDRINVGLDKLQ